MEKKKLQNRVRTPTFQAKVACIRNNFHIQRLKHKDNVKMNNFSVQ